MRYIVSFLVLQSSRRGRESWPQGYFRLNSAEHENYPAHNVKMPTIVDILTFICMINTPPERLKAGNFFICQYFSFFEQLKFRVQLS